MKTVLILFSFQHPATPKHDLSSIRFVICGAAPVAAELSEQFRKLVRPDTEVIQAYGMTESATAVTFVSFIVQLLL